MATNIESLNDSIRGCGIFGAQWVEVKVNSPVFYEIEERRIAKYGESKLDSEYAKNSGYVIVPLEEAYDAALFLASAEETKF